MLKPWMVAWIIYSIYACRNEINIFSLLYYLYSPYYHLWFVPSLFLSILLIAFILHKISNDTISAFLIFILGLFVYNLNSSEYHITGFISCYMIIFILLGIISRYMPEIAVRGGYFGGFIAFIIIADNIVDMTIETYRSYFQLPLCMLLCIFGFLPILQKQLFKNSILEFWGRYSLDIYLWHVIPILILQYIFTDNKITYYAVSFILLGILTAISYILTKK